MRTDGVAGGRTRAPGLVERLVGEKRPLAVVLLGRFGRGGELGVRRLGDAAEARCEAVEGAEGFLVLFLCVAEVAAERPERLLDLRPEPGQLGELAVDVPRVLLELEP